MNPQLATRLRSLRLSGMVDAFPGRLAQAQAAPFGHAEFLELLVEDELTRRADRLFARRLKFNRTSSAISIPRTSAISMRRDKLTRSSSSRRASAWRRCGTCSRLRGSARPRSCPSACRPKLPRAARGVWSDCMRTRWKKSTRRRSTRPCACSIPINAVSPGRGWN